MKNILINCIHDCLKGFPKAIGAIFPATQIQIYVAHQIRNSLKYIAEKDTKAFIINIKSIDWAINKEEDFENWFN